MMEIVKILKQDNPGADDSDIIREAVKIKG